MATQPVLPNEVERLADLRALEIMDTPEDPRFDRITRIAQRVFHVPIALISLVDEDRQWFLSRAGLEIAETPRETAFAAHTMADGGVLQVVDASSDERFRDNPLVTGEPGIRFYAGCTIESPSGSKLGSLCIIARQPRELDDKDVQILRDLATMVEHEIMALQLATTDTLTHLNNRRGLLASGRRILGFARRAGQPVCVVFLDLDGMTEINDTLGHEAGDRVLVQTARLLIESLRESDVIARLGGDKFCVLFTGASAQGAAAAIERLQNAIERKNQADESSPRLSVSIGLADWEPGSDETFDELLQRADHARHTSRRSNLE